MPQTQEEHEQELESQDTTSQLGSEAENVVIEEVNELNAKEFSDEDNNNNNHFSHNNFLDDVNKNVSINKIGHIIKFSLI